MRTQSYGYHHIMQSVMLVAVLLPVVAACSWISEELPECPPSEVHLRFEYDYNMMRSDVFKDHVGGLTVFVFDDNNNLVTQRSENDKERLKVYGYEMVFSDLEPDREYRFLALAYQKGEEEILQMPGAKFRRTEMKNGDPIEQLNVKLDRESDANADGTIRVPHENRALDTLWISRNDCRAKVRLQENVTTTLNLMRHTNNLTVTLRQTDCPADINIEDFEIKVTDRNGWVNYDNSLREDNQLTYTPYARWNTDFKDDEGTVVQRAAHADLSFPRLIYYEDWRENARLTIFNKKTNTQVADINLPDYLAQGRNSTEQQYSAQEFLDREYVFKLDFFLKGDTWDYVNLSISVLSWSVRIQNINL